MSKYNLDFVGLNTFIYEPVTWGDEDEFSAGFLDASWSGLETLTYGLNSAHKHINRVGIRKIIPLGGGLYEFPDETYEIHTYKNILFPYDLPTTASFFPALMIHRNGPYGWPAFKSTRLGQNPLSRRQRQHNILTVLGERKEITTRSGQILAAKYGEITLFSEPSVVTNHPVLFKMARDLNANSQYYRNSRNRANPINVIRRFSVKASYDNEVNMFSNPELDNILGIVQKEKPSLYEAASSMYLSGRLHLPITPMTRFKSFTFSQNLFPKEKYTFKSYTRQRKFFNFSWRHEQGKRVKERGRDSSIITDDTNIFASNNRPFSSSVWHLDVPDEWKNWPSYGSEPFVQRLGYYRKDNNEQASPFSTKKANTTTASYGLLWNTYSQASGLPVNSNWTSYGATMSTANYKTPNYYFRPGALYARRHTIARSASVVAPSGLFDIREDEDLLTSNYDFVFGGEAAWDTPISAGTYPFYDKYDDFSEDTKRIGKDYSIIPEFKISNFVEYYQTNDIQDSITDFLEVSGGHPNFNKSTTAKFFEVYSTTDFLKNFDVVLEDHEDFVEPSNLKITCNIISKFIPYDGFYPVQRTHQIAEQFYKSYNKNISGITGSVSYRAGTGITPATEFYHATDMVMRPLFGPGVLFNTIKSGVACDYPVLTSSLEIKKVKEDYMIHNDLFSKRVPFEALVEPQRHIANTKLINMEPHPSSSYRATGSWDGKGDNLYAKMTSNFLAEVPEFFLRGRNFTTLASLPSSSPQFGNVIAGKTYGMRVKMFRQTTGSVVEITSSNGREYRVPQDLINNKIKESFTMYSRPSAFGPPTYGKNEFEFANDAGSTNSSSVQNFEIDGFTCGRDNASDLELIYKDSRHGFNFPFTPPYYHGESWADIVFKPDASRKYSVQEIIASSSVKYYRYWTGSYADYSLNSTNMPGREQTDADGYGAQSFKFLNHNAMQLSSSVNLFGVAKLGEFNEFPVADPNEPARWTIQTKFETPILNFAEYENKTKITVCNNAASASIPRGMWHQYGRIPEPNQGIFLQVDDIPLSWQMGALKRSFNHLTSSLSDVCGFSNEPQKLGLMPRTTVLREAVVAIPFIEQADGRKFFAINKGRNDPQGKFAVDVAKKRIAGLEPTILESHYEEPSDEMINMVRKMQDFVMPPQMDFVNFPDDVNPFVVYIFDFERKVARKGLSNIWQGVLPPRLGVEHRKQSASISHNLLTSELLKQKDIKEQTLKWMVFKIKKRANTNYFNKVYTQKGGIPKKIVRGEFTDQEPAPFLGGKSQKESISYNWPYDFFSIIELVKIKADIRFADFDVETGLEREVVSRDLSGIDSIGLRSIRDTE